MNIIFMIDILINLRTTYINTKSGDEVYSPLMIAKRYILGGRFWIDFLSSLPLDSFQTGNNSTGFLGVFGMLKLMRISRITKIIQHLNIK